MSSEGVLKCQIQYEETKIKETQRESSLFFLLFFLSCYFFLTSFSCQHSPPPVVVLQDTFSYLGKSVKCLENTESPLWFSSPVLMMELRLDEVLETVTNTTRQSLECAR